MVEILATVMCAYTLDTWSELQAEAHVRGLFECFHRIVEREIAWREIPVEFGVDSYYARHEHHYIYWRLFGDGTVGIVTILHERMHQIDRFRDDAAP